MKRCVRTWCLLGAWVVPTLVGMESQAQEKTKKESRAALPPHVKEVMTAEQEKQARKIAESYEPELDKLRDEIRHMELASTKARMEREKFLDSLLSKEQKTAMKAYDAKAKAEGEKSLDELRFFEEELRDVRTKRDIEIEALLT